MLRGGWYRGERQTFVKRKTDPAADCRTQTAHKGAPSRRRLSVLLIFGVPLDSMVRSRRLELPRPFGHNDLNVARLPVPPRPHIMMVRTGPAPGRSGRLAKLFGRCKQASPLLFPVPSKTRVRGLGACHQIDLKESRQCHRSGVRPSSNHPSGVLTGGEATMILSRSPVVFHQRPGGAHRERRISWRLSHAFV